MFAPILGEHSERVGERIGNRKGSARVAVDIQKCCYAQGWLLKTLQTLRTFDMCPKLDKKEKKK